jgi:hypothetical protein
MAERKAENQTDNLILDQKMLGIDPISVHVGDV